MHPFPSPSPPQASTTGGDIIRTAHWRATQGTRSPLPAWNNFLSFLESSATLCFIHIRDYSSLYRSWFSQVPHQIGHSFPVWELLRYGSRPLLPGSLHRPEPARVCLSPGLSLKLSLGRELGAVVPHSR